LIKIYQLLGASKMSRARYYRVLTFRVEDPKLTNSKPAKVENTENDENELEDEEQKLKDKQKALSEAEIDRAHAMHEVGHAAVASLLGCEVIDIRYSKWYGGGLTRANYDKSRLSVPDRVTVLVAGGVAERMVGGSGGDRDDLVEARQIASDEQIARARKRAKEILRANWGGCLTICDALQKWPLLKGSLVRTLLAASRVPTGLTTRVNEDIVTQRFEVCTDKGGRRRRVGKVCLIGRYWHAYRGHQNDWCGMFDNYLEATRAI
jgi:hypothetical protein